MTLLAICALRRERLTPCKVCPPHSMVRPQSSSRARALEAVSPYTSDDRPCCHILSLSVDVLSGWRNAFCQPPRAERRYPCRDSRGLVLEIRHRNHRLLDCSSFSGYRWRPGPNPRSALPRTPTDTSSSEVSRPSQASEASRLPSSPPHTPEVRAIVGGYPCYHQTAPASTQCPLSSYFPASVRNEHLECATGRQYIHSPKGAWRRLETRSANIQGGLIEESTVAYELVYPATIVSASTRMLAISPRMPPVPRDPRTRPRCACDNATVETCQFHGDFLALGPTKFHASSLLFITAPSFSRVQ